MHTNFSIILPCYNESENIHELYNEILNLNVVNSYFEIIFVDNGSTDGTGFKIDEIIQISSKVKIQTFLLQN